MFLLKKKKKMKFHMSRISEENFQVFNQTMWTMNDISYTFHIHFISDYSYCMSTGLICVYFYFSP